MSADNYLTREEVAKEFRKWLRVNYDRDNHAAADLGMLPSRISQIVTGIRPPPPKVLEVLGYEKVTIYRKKAAIDHHPV